MVGAARIESVRGSLATGRPIRIRVRGAAESMRIQRTLHAVGSCLALAVFSCIPRTRHVVAPADSLQEAKLRHEPYRVSWPPAREAEYIVTVRSQFDHYVVAETIARRVGGRIGYMYANFNIFSVYGISKTCLAVLKRMPEVLSVENSVFFKLD